jgi:hypothetical protein
MRRPTECDSRARFWNCRRARVRRAETPSRRPFSRELPLRRRVQRWAQQDRARRAPIGGAELLELGFAGPALGRALARIRAAFLDHRVNGRDEALALARELLRSRAQADRGD